jgi:hypothetical protein
MSLSDSLKLPPILRLPTELHIHIVSFLTTEELTCCLTGVGSNSKERELAWHNGKTTKTSHNASSDHDTEPITITHSAVLFLRSTNTYFLSLIPLSQELLLRIERHPSTPQTPIGPPKACCVCLRLRPSDEFPISTPSELSHNAYKHVVQSLDCGANYRFCRDCGFHAYPHPHPALGPRRQQRRRGIEPLQLTTYKPGTKLIFQRRSPKTRVRHDVWVWCMDCRLLKTSTASGDVACPIFCAECCTRLGCRVIHHNATGARVIQYLHTGYAQIEEEITEEKRRREHRLSAGAVYVAQGRSLLLKNVERPADDEEEVVRGHLKDPVWKNWFDLEGYPMILQTPSIRVPSGWRKLPVCVAHVCTLFRRPLRDNALEPFVTARFLDASPGRLQKGLSQEVAF